jgi:hypothetical protein
MSYHRSTSFPLGEPSVYLYLQAGKDEGEPSLEQILGLEKKLGVRDAKENT